MIVRNDDHNTFDGVAGALSRTLPGVTLDGGYTLADEIHTPDSSSFWRAGTYEDRLAKGELDWKGRRVNPKAIRRTALFTIEGERDDICAIGQTVAAHDLCSSLRPYRKKHYMQAGVGHYGVFSGKRWNNEIYPLLRDFVHVNS